MFRPEPLPPRAAGEARTVAVEPERRQAAPAAEHAPASETAESAQTSSERFPRSKFLEGTTLGLGAVILGLSVVILGLDPRIG